MIKFKLFKCSIFEFADYQTSKTPKLCHSDGFLDCGGEAFTSCLMRLFIDTLKAESRARFEKLRERLALDPEGEKVLKGKLRKEAEKAKVALMELDETR